MRLTRRAFLGSAALPLLAQKRPLARKDSFFGLHFDLHANPNDSALGRDVTEEMVERIITGARPDYIQYDCKGHNGHLAYPSQVSKSAPNIVWDSLEIYRRVTARNGVALYAHFSGVWDTLAVTERPEWARGRPDGKQEDRQTSTFGSYVDERMIPQLREAATQYRLDGAWVDGECWATGPDYSPRAAAAFRETTGIQELPRGPQDPGWLEFLEFNREKFRRYVRHYVDALHQSNPGFQIASNWLYTTYVPEKPTLPVDFLSGDYLGDASIARARLDARYLAAVDKPWDLMAWGFQSGRNSSVGAIHKPAMQIQQEAAVVLAQGGGFQVYYQPSRAGKFDDRLIAVMAQVGRFCRERQKASHRSATVPQAAVLFSRHSLYATAHKLFGGWPAAVMHPVQGTLGALLDSQFSVDVLPDWKLEAAASYPLVVVPEWPDIGAEAVQALSQYAESGGALLLFGAENARAFAPVLGARLIGEAKDRPALIPTDDLFANVKGVWQDVEPAGADVLAHRHPTWDFARDAVPAATLARHGKGRVVAAYGPLGTVYSQTHAPATRQVVAALAKRLFTPQVTVSGPATVEVSLRYKNRRLLVHLGNTTNMQVASDYGALDFVPPVGPLKVSVRLPQAPTRVTLEPGGGLVSGEWRNGMWWGTVSRLDIHVVLAFA